MTARSGETGARARHGSSSANADRTRCTRLPRVLLCLRSHFRTPIQNLMARMAIGTRSRNAITSNMEFLRGKAPPRRPHSSLPVEHVRPVRPRRLYGHDQAALTATDLFVAQLLADLHQ